VIQMVQTMCLLIVVHLIHLKMTMIHPEIMIQMNQEAIIHPATVPVVTVLPVETMQAVNLHFKSRDFSVYSING
jgi:hypothetical protein